MLPEKDKIKENSGKMVAWDIPHTSIQCSNSNSASCGPIGRDEPRPVTLLSPLCVSTLGLSTKAQGKDLKAALPKEKVHFSSPGLQGLPDPKNLQRRWTFGLTHLYLWDSENTKRSQSKDALSSLTERVEMDSLLYVQQAIVQRWMLPPFTLWSTAMEAVLISRHRKMASH